MKLILLSVFLSFVSALSAQTYTVVLQVNMSEEVTASQVTVAGDFQQAAGFPSDWTPGQTFMSDANMDDTYDIILTLPTGTFEYLFINGTTWGSDEAVPGVCNFNGNRQMVITGDTVIEPVCFGQCIDCGCVATFSTDPITACGSYTWIDGVTYTASNNSAVDTLVNAAGCDSIVTLDLTINNLPSTMITENGGTLTVDENNATYQWLDCDNNFAILSNETNQGFTPMANGNYAVQVVSNNCTDTSACFNVNFMSIDELNPISKELVKVVDLMGRETKTTSNTPLIYIYNDGTRERVILIDK